MVDMWWVDGAVTSVRRALKKNRVARVVGVGLSQFLGRDRVVETGGSERVMFGWKYHNMISAVRVASKVEPRMLARIYLKGYEPRGVEWVGPFVLMDRDSARCLECLYKRYAVESLRGMRERIS